MSTNKYAPGSAEFWLRAALDCPQFHWDQDQRECAEAALAANEAEKQAGPVAFPKSIDLPDDWRERAADSALALADPETWARARGAPASESDKEDAELTDEEIKRVHDHGACLPDLVGLKDQWPEVLRFARAVLRAARAKKEQS